MRSCAGRATGGGWLGVLAILLVAVRGLAATLPVAATGATVDEGRVSKILYVDPAHTEAGDDDQHGSVDAPFATLTFACQEAAAAKNSNVGVKIVLASGTYREAAEIPPPPGGTDTDAPLIIEAAEHDQAIVDGADTGGWSASTWKDENGRWTHPWPFPRAAKPRRRPLGPADTAAYHPGDLIFVNGTPLRQVNTESDLAAGTFWENVPPTAGRPARGRPAPGAIVEVWPPEDTPLDGAIVQVGVRPCGLKISRRRNVVVRGILLQHGASPAVSGGTIGLGLVSCANVLVEDVLCQWNDGTGLVVDGGESVTLRRVRALHNGGAGLESRRTVSLLVEDCEVSFNSFRAEWAAWVDPQGDAAVSALDARGGTWRRLHCIGNVGRGVLLRAGADLTVEDSVIQGNRLNGLAVQACPGPVLVRRCVVIGTRAAPAAPGKETGGVGGVTLTDSADVSLVSNILAGNDLAQLAWWEPDRPKAPSRSAHYSGQHNVLLGLAPDQWVCELPGNDGASGLDPAFFRSLDADHNCFWNAATTDAFAATGRAGNPAPAMDLAKWQEALAGRAGAGGAGPASAPPGAPEAHSIWEDPLFVNPAEGDYRLRKSSPVADWNLPSDEAAAAQ